MAFRKTLLAVGLLALSCQLMAQEKMTVGIDLLNLNYSLSGYALLDLKAELENPSIIPDQVRTKKLEKKEEIIQSAVHIPKAWCYEDLAVFCKLEVKLEKTIKVPVKFRIGEVNYAEMREGKPYSPSLY